MASPVFWPGDAPSACLLAVSLSPFPWRGGAAMNWTSIASIWCPSIRSAAFLGVVECGEVVFSFSFPQIHAFLCLWAPLCLHFCAEPTEISCQQSLLCAICFQLSSFKLPFSLISYCHAVSSMTSPPSSSFLECQPSKQLSFSSFFSPPPLFSPLPSAFTVVCVRASG